MRRCELEPFWRSGDSPDGWFLASKRRLDAPQAVAPMAAIRVSTLAEGQRRTRQDARASRSAHRGDDAQIVSANDRYCLPLPNRSCQLQVTRSLATYRHT